MPFATVTEKFSGESKFKKTEFIALPPGITTIRILEDSAHRSYVHYVKGTYVECLGEDCPICRNNKQIIMENPKEFRNIPNYSGRVERHAVNVYDRTMVKICPSCGKENKKVDQSYPSVCECGQMLVTTVEQPLNKVKILAKGKDLFSKLNVLEMSVLDANREPLGLKNFDITLFVSGTGRDTVITPVPQAMVTDVIPEQELFDTGKVNFKLTEAEILDLMKGVQLRDILTARRSSASDTVIKEEVVDTSKAVQEQINSLFNN